MAAPLHSVDHLMATNGERIRSLCRRLCQREDWAEDAFQETWLDYHRALTAGQAPDDPLGWLITTARRHCAKTIRSETRRRRREARPPEPATAPDPSHLCERQDAVTTLGQALADLPDRHRTPLVLRYLDQRPITEVARRLGTSEATARVRIHRALAKLKRRIGVAAPIGLLLGGDASKTAMAMTNATASSSITITSPFLTLKGLIVPITLTATIATTVAVLAILGSPQPNAAASEAPGGPALSVPRPATEPVAIIPGSEDEAVNPEPEVSNEADRLAELNRIAKISRAVAHQLNIKLAETEESLAASTQQLEQAHVEIATMRKELIRYQRQLSLICADPQIGSEANKILVLATQADQALEDQSEHSITPGTEKF